jgi:HAD superfamily hydrolase (TIGR01509 family)
VGRAFLFDLDGTLVDTERENAESIVRALAGLGRAVSAEERAFVVGHGWREIYAHLAERGVPLSFEELKERAAAEKERLCEGDALRVLPGAVEFVRRAAARGPCAVVSGSSRREIAWAIGRLGLERAFALYVGAEDVARGKPAPDGFLAAARALVIPPADCTVFEDSAHGIAAARAAGMRCVALGAGNFQGQDQSAADLCVPSFAALGDSLWADAAAGGA